LAATAVNAPMVPAEVLAELQPFVSLSQGLGTAAVQLVRDTGFTDVKITYHSPRSALNSIHHRVNDLHLDGIWTGFGVLATLGKYGVQFFCYVCRVV